LRCVAVLVAVAGCCVDYVSIVNTQLVELLSCRQLCRFYCLYFRLY
jgi:hypothetical protein